MAKKIMVVDDEKSLLQLVDSILRQEGYDVIMAASGEECLEMLKTEKPDLILLDMMMPRLSGREVCERIRENPKTKDLKIAFLTVAQFSSTGKDILKKMHVLDYIAKPFDNTDLIRRIERALSKK